MNNEPPQFTESTRADCLRLIELALIEDLGSSDLGAGVDCTTAAIVPPDAKARAAFISRDRGVVCGIEVAKIILDRWAPQVELEVMLNDGDEVTPQQKIAIMSGPAHDILTMERTCLNFMCRLSGISTLVAQFVGEIQGTAATVLDTRKTTPAWRRLEKYAVVCGGGTNHRMGLYDAIMIKDNHLAFYLTQVEDRCDAIPGAVSESRRWIAENATSLPSGSETMLLLEVDTLAQLEIALTTDCDVVLLDNMDCEQLRTAVEIRDRSAASILLEASGGVDLTTVGDIARTGVERISVGALTHSASNFDIGLDWESRA